MNFGPYDWPWISESHKREAERLIAMGPSGADEAERFFMGAFEACNKDHMRCALDVIDATGAQSRVLLRLIKLTPQDNERTAFRSFWDEHGSIFRMKVADDSALCDALRNLLEPYKGHQMTLYRGEIAAQHDQEKYGMSWTPYNEVARMFAKGRNCLPPDGGVVLESEVPAKAIISPPSDESKRQGEYEFVVDPRGLEIRTMERCTPNAKH